MLGSTGAEIARRKASKIYQKLGAATSSSITSASRIERIPKLSPEERFSYLRRKSRKRTLENAGTARNLRQRRNCYTTSEANRRV